MAPTLGRPGPAGGPGDQPRVAAGAADQHHQPGAHEDPREGDPDRHQPAAEASGERRSTAGA